LLAESSYLLCPAQLKAEVARGPLRVQMVVPDAPPMVVHL
jgi:hypothetical protein